MKKREAKLSRALYSAAVEMLCKTMTVIFKLGRCECDLEQYLRKDMEPSQKTIGTYMSEYSWAENSLAVD